MAAPHAAVADISESESDSSFQRVSTLRLASAAAAAGGSFSSGDGYVGIPTSPTLHEEFDDDDLEGGASSGAPRPRPSVLAQLRYLAHFLALWLEHLAGRYVPAVKWVGNYSQGDLLADILAGITVGFFIVPQGVAYSFLAGVPPNFGLYTAVFPPLFYAVFASSRHVAFGPDAVTALLIGNAVHEAVLRVNTAGSAASAAAAGATGAAAGAAAGAAVAAGKAASALTPEELMPYVTMMSLTIGLVLLAFGMLRLGFLDNVLSHAVVAGLIVAVALTIMVSQVAYIFAFPPCTSKVCPETPLLKLIANVEHLVAGNTHVPTMVLAAVTFVGMHALYKLKDRLKNVTALRHLPVVLIVVVVSLTASYALGFQAMKIKVVGHVASGFVAPTIPDEPFQVFLACIRPALAIASIVFIKSVIVAKEQASLNRYAISPDQELRAMGLANTLSALCGAFTASGSLARTKVSVNAGARTPLTLVVASGIALLAVFFLMPLLRHLPSVTLAVIITHTVAGLIEPNLHTVRGMIKVKAFTDVALFSGMVAVAFVTDIETGLVFGFGACLLLLLKQASKATVQMLGVVLPPRVDFAAELEEQGDATTSTSTSTGVGVQALPPEEFSTPGAASPPTTSSPGGPDPPAPSSSSPSDPVLSLLSPAGLATRALALTPAPSHGPASPSAKSSPGTGAGAAATWTGVDLDDASSRPEALLVPGLLALRLFGALHFGNCQAVKGVITKAAETVASLALPTPLPPTSSSAAAARSGAASSFSQRSAAAAAAAGAGRLRAVVLDLQLVPSADASAIEMLHSLVDLWLERRVAVALVLHQIDPPPQATSSPTSPSTSVSESMMSRGSSSSSSSSNNSNKSSSNAGSNGAAGSSRNGTRKLTPMTTSTSSAAAADSAVAASGDFALWMGGSKLARFSRMLRRSSPSAPLETLVFLSGLADKLNSAALSCAAGDASGAHASARGYSAAPAGEDEAGTSSGAGGGLFLTMGSALASLHAAGSLPSFLAFARLAHLAASGAGVGDGDHGYPLRVTGPAEMGMVMHGLHSSVRSPQASPAKPIVSNSSSSSSTSSSSASGRTPLTSRAGPMRTAVVLRQTQASAGPFSRGPSPGPEAVATAVAAAAAAGIGAGAGAQSSGGGVALQGNGFAAPAPLSGLSSFPALAALSAKVAAAATPAKVAD